MDKALPFNLPQTGIPFVNTIRPRSIFLRNDVGLARAKCPYFTAALQEAVTTTASPSGASFTLNPQDCARSRV